MSAHKAEVVKTTLERVRDAIQSVISEANQTTEAEVINTGTAVHEIVETASSQIEMTRVAISALQDEDGRSALHRVARQQHEMITDFMVNVRSAQDRQSKALIDAEAQSKGILRIGEAIRALASSSRILSLNAQIESQRLGEQGAAFEVIAAEMQRMSARVSEANTEVARLAEGLLGALPVCIEQGEVLSEQTESFSRDFQALVEQMDQGVDMLEDLTQQTMEIGESHGAEIVTASHKAISHLQFQDPVAQRLMRIDTLFVELQREVAEALGERPDDWAIAKEVHTEIGARMGETLFDDSETPEAGELLLF
ncbi:MAG: methyl-accepting chemotaxis protein [Bradymonadia bacterium]